MINGIRNNESSNTIWRKKTNEDQVTDCSWLSWFNQNRSTTATTVKNESKSDAFMCTYNLISSKLRIKDPKPDLGGRKIHKCPQTFLSSSYYSSQFPLVENELIDIDRNRAKIDDSSWGWWGCLPKLTMYPILLQKQAKSDVLFSTLEIYFHFAYCKNTNNTIQNNTNCRVDSLRDFLAHVKPFCDKIASSFEIIVMSANILWYTTAIYASVE